MPLTVAPPPRTGDAAQGPLTAGPSLGAAPDHAAPPPGEPAMEPAHPKPPAATARTVAAGVLFAALRCWPRASPWSSSPRSGCSASGDGRSNVGGVAVDPARTGRSPARYRRAAGRRDARLGGHRAPRRSCSRSSSRWPGRCPASGRGRAGRDRRRRRSPSPATAAAAAASASRAACPSRSSPPAAIAFAIAGAATAELRPLPQNTSEPRAADVTLDEDAFLRTDERRSAESRKSEAREKREAPAEKPARRDAAATGGEQRRRATRRRDGGRRRRRTSRRRAGGGETPAGGETTERTPGGETTASGETGRRRR